MASLGAASAPRPEASLSAKDQQIYNDQMYNSVGPRPASEFGPDPNAIPQPYGRRSSSVLTSIKIMENEVHAFAKQNPV